MQELRGAKAKFTNIGKCRQLAEFLALHDEGESF